VIRLLSRLRARVVAFLGSTVQADQERSLRVRMNNFPPPPSPLLSCHGWISGVAMGGTLAQTGQPYGASLAFGAAVRLGLPSHTPSRERLGLYKPASISCDCLRLMVTSNGSHKGLPPSVIHPCPTHLSRATPSFGSARHRLTDSQHPCLLHPSPTSLPSTVITKEAVVSSIIGTEGSVRLIRECRLRHHRIYHFRGYQTDRRIGPRGRRGRRWW